MKVISYHLSSLHFEICLYIFFWKRFILFDMSISEKWYKQNSIIYKGMSYDILTCLKSLVIFRHVIFRHVYFSSRIVPSTRQPLLGRMRVCIQNSLFLIRNYFYIAMNLWIIAKRQLISPIKTIFGQIYSCRDIVH